ncbi:MAG: FAD:protein FMN transferase [Candidatus Woesearchaeota archaeon]|nr:FAD:protein FMN transferase [Candidatus Woesearchaeota archaeon]
MASVKLFGDSAEIILYDVDPKLQPILIEDIYERALTLQKIFNFYDLTSELSILNTKRKLKASPDLLEVLKKAIHYSAETDWAYDVTKGKQTAARKNKEEIPKVSCTSKDIMIKGSNVTLLNDDVLIDLGSIAKGYITDKVIDYMKELGIESGYMDSRGDLRIFGNYAELIDVQHPRDKRKSIGSFVMDNCAVATSGDYNQYDNSFSKNHIIGSRDIISISVVHDNLTDADALATCAFVMEVKDAIPLLKRHGAKALIIDSRLNKTFVNSEEEEWTRR